MASCHKITADSLSDMQNAECRALVFVHLYLVHFPFTRNFSRETAWSFLRRIGGISPSPPKKMKSIFLKLSEILLPLMKDYKGHRINDVLASSFKRRRDTHRKLS